MRNIVLKIIGGAIILWGLADYGVSLGGYDLWGMVGIRVPSAIYPYTHYAAFLVGLVIFLMGSKPAEGLTDDDDE